MPDPWEDQVGNPHKTLRPSPGIRIRLLHLSFPRNQNETKKKSSASDSKQTTIFNKDGRLLFEKTDNGPPVGRPLFNAD